jgi:NhaC family Na+:H+ antiporter
MTRTIKAPSMVDALIPLITLIILLSLSVGLYGSDSSYGPNQIALFLASGVGIIIGLKNGHRWVDLEKAMIHGISLSLGAVLILLAVGSLIGTWLLSGTVPSLIYFGLQILDPAWFYAATCLICAFVSLAIGSSWTTAATIGVALLGVATGLGMSVVITAGAIISGAYFGDKLSPLSDTTNLAPAMAGADLFDHIRHMLWTTIPSFLLALLIFIILGQQSDGHADTAKISLITNELKAKFHISLWMLLPMVLLMAMAAKKVAAFPTVAIGALVGVLWALIFQQPLLSSMQDAGLSTVAGQLKIIWSTLHGGFVFQSGLSELDKLLSGGGMAKMMNTVWLIISAMVFGAVLEYTGLLARFVQAILAKAKSTGSLITSTILTCIATNILTADQYMAIVMPGRMYKEEYARRGLAPVNLSRTLEDGGTITSPLVPWNTCGAYMQGVLNVSPLDYIFYAFFNLINPVLAIVYAYLGIKVLKLTPPDSVHAMFEPNRHQA